MRDDIEAVFKNYNTSHTLLIFNLGILGEAEELVPKDEEVLFFYPANLTVNPGKAITRRIKAVIVLTDRQAIIYKGTKGKPIFLPIDRITGFDCYGWDYSEKQIVIKTADEYFEMTVDIDARGPQMLKESFRIAKEAYSG